MRSINKVILVGNLTRDPEVRQTPNGQAVTTFGIATNRDWVTRDGQRHTSSEFHEVVAWSKLAEISGQYLKKGKLVYIEGYLKTRSWDTPEGIKKFKTEIVIQDLIMLEKREYSHEPERVALQNNSFAQANTNLPEGEDYIPEENMENDAVANTQQERKPTSNHPKSAKTEQQSETADTMAAQGPLDIDDDLGL